MIKAADATRRSVAVATDAEVRRSYGRAMKTRKMRLMTNNSEKMIYSLVSNAMRCRKGFRGREVSYKLGSQQPIGPGSF